MGRCLGLRHQPNADSPGMRIVVWATLLAVLLVAVPAAASAVSRERTRAAGRAQTIADISVWRLTEELLCCAARQIV